MAAPEAAPVWRCCCGTLNEGTHQKPVTFCTGCRFDVPPESVEARYLLQPDTTERR